MLFPPLLRLLIVCSSTLLAAGCASVTVQRTKEVEKVAPFSTPKIIRVVDFDTTGAKFYVDRRGGELKRFKTKTAKALTAFILAQMRKNLVTPAQECQSPDKVCNGWLVRGRLIRVIQGSRALRTVVGCGAGRTTLETEVCVYNLSRSLTEPFLKFQTTGTSGSHPGALVSPGGVVEAAATAGLQSLGGLTDDCKRTAKVITEKIAAYMRDQPWFEPEKFIRPNVDEPAQPDQPAQVEPPPAAPKKSAKPNQKRAKSKKQKSTK
ncbi:MAG: DUF4410 domain-containing protein [Verrucomicrobiae bacterium]|nr:DUF4410 domain-containing protein [Verrucomicrobiae bacterium]